ncbi:uncharacterized protein LOC131802642 isoform X1 [Musca domestica]|uniref:Uncharacterized protein LOC131802642 isoform X1 n=1 Tax=Musca domestica TaxID=7370 RepID=A0A1I8M253_MUSDO|nr:uncharacterized protein LOC131802642 isoform X1 [Musca domestica]
MTTQSGVFICAIGLGIIVTCYATIRPSTSLHLMEGEGFVIYLDVPKNFGAIKNCWFKFRGNDKERIDLNATEPIDTSRGEHILPYENDVCGIRVMGVTAASAAIWTLEMENYFGDYEQGSATIQILPFQKTKFDTRVQMEFGKGTIKCSKPDSAKHCKIVDLYYGETYRDCQLYTTIHPGSSFECYVYNWGRMEESYERIFVDTLNGTLPSTNATLNENNKAITISCDFQSTVYSCQAEKPDRKTELLIMDGVYNGYYSAAQTITTKSKCELEIPKPLKDSDSGLWRIMSYSTSGIPKGCLFYVGKSKSDIILSELSNMPQLTTVKVYKPEDGAKNVIEELSCNVPFEIHDCYLRDPNKTIYIPESIRFDSQRLYGKCAFYNMPIIQGIWLCGARGRDYDKEVVQNIEVITKSKYGETLTEVVKVKRGDAAELMCKSPFDEPISHCAFIDPNGGVFLVGTVNSIKSKGRIQYYGRGITKGDCGIKITDINRDDYGQWKCQFIIRSGNLKSSFTMELKELDTAHATSVGLAIGLTVVLILVVGVVIGTFIYRRRNLSARHNLASTDPLELAGPSSISHETS